METKVCSKCGLEKDINDFPLRNRLTKRRQSYCKSCTSIMGSNWYAKNRGHQMKNAGTHTIEQRQALREYVMNSSVAT